MHAADWLGMAVAAKLLHAPSPGATGLKAEVTTTLTLTPTVDQALALTLAPTLTITIT